MNSTLLAFDLIAPMIGGVVLAGAFSFFGGVLLARKKAQDLTTVLGDRFAPGLEAEIQRLNLERIHQLIVSKQHSSKLSDELKSTQDMLELRAIIDAHSEEPFQTLERFAKRLCESANADRAAIYFVARRNGEQLQPIVQCGSPLSPEDESAWNRNEQALASIAIESELGSWHDDEWLRTLQVNSPITAAATMPIRVNGRVLGALCLTRQGHDGSLEGSRRLIEFGAETLSQTFHRVFEEATIRRQARHDHLTDLVNRRSFDAYLATEVERIQLRESPVCSLILMDLDRFKLINDRYGHLGGDHVLRETARVLAAQVTRLRMGERSIVARYGGEEFAILLPGVGMAGALRIAEEIRVSIETESIHLQDAQFHVTTSIGVAVCPEQAASAEALIAIADKALYQAKANGRNCVCRPDDIVP